MKKIYKAILVVIMFYNDYTDETPLPKGETTDSFWEKRKEFYKKMCGKMLEVID
jgi:hypothetical protein